MNVFTVIVHMKGNSVCSSPLIYCDMEVDTGGVESICGESNGKQKIQTEIQNTVKQQVELLQNPLF